MISCLQKSLQDTTIIALSCRGSNVFRPSRLLPLATYGHTYRPPSVILLLHRIFLLHRTGATLPLYLSAVCFLLHTQPMYIAHHSPPPFQSNNSLQPLGNSPNLCVISKRPAWPTFILDPLFSFPFFVFIGADQVYSTTHRVTWWHVVLRKRLQFTHLTTVPPFFYTRLNETKQQTLPGIRRSYTYRIGA